MRIRRTNALFIVIIFILAMFGLYLMLDRTTTDRTPSNGGSDINEMEREVSLIEEEIRSNHKTLGLIRQVLKDLAAAKKSNERHDASQLDSVRKLTDHLAEESRRESHAWRRLEHTQQVRLLNVSECPAQSASADIRMMDIYERLSFDNPDGGAWKQGYPITYDAGAWDRQKLQVFVVPHSHTDPGWRKTLDDYYTTETRHIFDSMLRFLLDHPDMRFVYAEMAFFTMWWADLNNQQRNDVRRLIREGRLEILTGGWVMNDEANTHYFAMVDQLFEGHQFLMSELNVRPNVSWSIDPFGYTPTMAYLARRCGFHAMLIQRVHYSVKKHLSRQRELEYIWRQHWDVQGNNDIFAHMMPFYSYDQPHTCGPEPAICCQFDFARLPGGRHTCPWNIPPRPIHDGNLHERASMLLDQYRKKSTLFRHNVVLVPLGDDFRYIDTNEWTAQHSNYKRLFDYINAKKEWNTEVRFATLSDYFNAVRKRAGLNIRTLESTPEESLPKGYPTLVGDMFTYADRDDHYWSGYFTSRPYHKRLERVFESYLRSAEIVFGLAIAHNIHRGAGVGSNQFPIESLSKWLTSARRQLALFQHHDGVTGTGKAHVMEDYGKRMLNGLIDARRILALSSHFIMAVNKDKESFDAVNDDAQYVLGVDERWESIDRLPHGSILTIKADAQRHVVFFNSLAQPREALVTLHISSPHVEVRSPGNQPMMCQVDPLFSDMSSATPRHDAWQLRFSVQLGPLALERYSIRVVGPEDPTACPKAEVVLYNAPEADDSLHTSSSPFTIRRRSGGSPFSLDNTQLRVHLSARGLLQAVESRTGELAGRRLPIDIRLVKYGARSTRERSGAYIFLPDGQGEEMLGSSPPPVLTLRGPVVQEATLINARVQHKVRVVETRGSDAASVHLENVVDVRATDNYELAMRLNPSSTWMDNKAYKSGQAEFYTDLNCYQMIRREAWTKLPLQANVYPMPCAAMMEDPSHGMRLTVLSGQPLGAGAIQKGQLDIFLDRRLNQDDNRGLGESLLDNRPTHSTFRLLVEPLLGRAWDKTPDNGYLSATASLALHDLLHPPVAMPVRPDVSAPTRLVSSFSLLTGVGLPCDYHLVNLKSLDRPGEVALIIHRTQFDCRQHIALGASCRLLPKNDQHITLTSLFNDLIVASVERTTLTRLQSLGHVPDKRVDIAPMDLETFQLKFK